MSRVVHPDPEGTPTSREDQVIQDAGTELELRGSGCMQQKAVQLVGHPRFDATIGFLIGMNAICLGVETDHPNPKQMWQGIEIGFLCAFSSELVVRFVALRGFFLRDGWCLFDSGLIGISIMDLTMSGSLTHLTILRILRLLRLVRALKLIRMFRPLYLLLKGLIDNALAMFWVGFLMIVVLYTFAVILTRLIGQHSMFEGTEIQDRFSTVMSSMFQLFVLMTFEDWYNAFIVPVLGTSPILALVFICFLMLTSFSVLNILCGLFVSSTMMAAESQASEICEGEDNIRQERFHRLKEVFNLGDVNHDGVMTVQEFGLFVSDPKIANALRLLGVKAKDACELFQLLDADGNASLKVGEFIAGCARLCDKASGRDIVVSHYQLSQKLYDIQEEFVIQQQQADAHFKESFDRLDAVDACVDRLSAIYKNGQHQQMQSTYGRVDRLCSVLDGALCSSFARGIGPNEQLNQSDTDAPSDKFDKKAPNG